MQRRYNDAVLKNKTGKKSFSYEFVDPETGEKSVKLKMLLSIIYSGRLSAGKE